MYILSPFCYHCTRDEKRKDIKSPPEEGNLLSSYSQVPIPEDSNLKLSLRFSNNMLK